MNYLLRTACARIHTRTHMNGFPTWSCLGHSIHSSRSRSRGQWQTTSGFFRVRPWLAAETSLTHTHNLTFSRRSISPPHKSPRRMHQHRSSFAAAARLLCDHFHRGSFSYYVKTLWRWLCLERIRWLNCLDWFDGRARDEILRLDYGCGGVISDRRRLSFITRRRTRFWFIIKRDV